MGYPDKEKQKEYNKQYHEKNQEAINDKLCIKKECEYCKRIVQHKNMLIHHQTKYCEKRRLMRNKFEAEKIKI